MEAKEEQTLDGPDSDSRAGFRILPNFARFAQKNDVFRRSWWDSRIRTAKSELFYRTYRTPLETWRRGDGFKQRDYALRNAAWHVSDVLTEMNENEDRREGFTDAFSLQRAPAKEPLDLGSPEETTREIKQVALAFGAGMVGVTAFDQRWEYSSKWSDASGTERPAEIPADLHRVIVVAQPMDFDLLATVPSALSGAATGLGYSQDALVVLSLAQYIRNLGYRSVASMNDSSLAIPYAIKAGLGEYGRNGLLITPEFGPRVRLGKVYTDLPLDLDQPIRFGVREFCRVCRRCSDSCPVGAIPAGPPSAEVHNQSNIQGVEKWTVDGEKCFSYWAAQNSDCSICIRVCPYNKDYSKWWVRWGRRLASTPLRSAMAKLDQWLGFGTRRPPRTWWRPHRGSGGRFRSKTV